MIPEPATDHARGIIIRDAPSLLICTDRFGIDASRVGGEHN
jgi:hypothetical protein